MNLPTGDHLDVAVQKAAAVASRRAFLGTAAALPAALLAAGAAPGTTAVPGDATKPSAMPQIQLGQHSISRLICGSNPFNGVSHLSGFLNRAMREYYTPEQVLKTVRRCQEVDINCWQSSMAHCELYQRYFKEEGRMKFLAIDYQPANIPALAQAGCIGIAYHGERTDILFKSGRIDEVREYLKRVRDAGLLVGVSTHMPAAIWAIESKGWDVDYYMTCLYEPHRTVETLAKELGQAPLPVGEVYLSKDPARMFKAIRQTARPCLAFKILAAGRLADRREWVERAFRETLQAIKPSDGVIVGMYDHYGDQPAANAEMVRRFAPPGRS